MSQSENRPSTPNYSYIDVLHDVDFSYLSNKITKIESDVTELTRDNPDAMYEDDMPAEGLDDLSNEMLLDEPRKAIFSGVVYRPRSQPDFGDHDRFDANSDEGEDVLELDIDSPELLLDVEVTFDGPEFTEIDDAKRIVFAMKRTIGDGVTARHESSYFAAFASGMLRLEYLQESLGDTIMRLARTSQDLVTDDEFLSLGFDDQVKTLESLAMAIVYELGSFADVDEVTIAASVAFERPESKTAKGGQLPSCVEAVALDGSIVAVEFPDILMRGRRPFRQANDFTFGTVPYVAVRTNDLQKTLYCRLDSITKLE